MGQPIEKERKAGKESQFSFDGVASEQTIQEARSGSVQPEAKHQAGAETLTCSYRYGQLFPNRNSNADFSEQAFPRFRELSGTGVRSCVSYGRNKKTGENTARVRSC
jgi:hypothetical protein